MKNKLTIVIAQILVLMSIGAGNGFAQAVDNEPPYLDNANPAAGEVQVSVDANIVFHVKDETSGIDIGSLTVQVQREEDATATTIILNGQNQLTSFPGNVQISMLSDKDYRIQYDPPDTADYWLSYGETVSVTVMVKDKNANALNTTYSFMIADRIMGANIRVHQAAGGEQRASDMVMDNNAKNVYVVWQDSNGIWFAASADRGKTFGSEVRLSSAIPGTNESASIAVDSPGNIYVAWQNKDGDDDYDLYFARKLKNGSTFEVRVIPLDNQGAANQKYPRLCVGGGDVILSWVNANTDGVYLAQSGDEGASFWQIAAEDIIRVDDQTGLKPGCPGLAIDGSGHGKVLCWSAEKSGKRNIYFNKLDKDNQRVFGNDIQVNDADSGDAAEHPWIACRNTINNSGNKANICIVWENEKDQDWDIRFDKSGDGSSWGADIRVNDDSTAVRAQKEPRVAMDNNGDIFCAWTDFRNITDADQNSDIYSTYSVDNGASFKSNVRVNDDGAAARQAEPALYLSAGGKHFCLTWTDYRDGTADIFFSRNSLIDSENAFTLFVYDDAGTDMEKDGYGVTVPAYALAASSYISITPIEFFPEFPAMPRLLRNYIDFGPGGMTFEKPVTITLPYTQNDLDDAGVTDPSLLRIYVYNLKKLVWERISNVTLNRSQQTVSCALFFLNIRFGRLGVQDARYGSG